MNEKPTLAKPLAEWYVMGRAIVERNFGIQERADSKFWSAVLTPIYPDLNGLDYKTDFYASCFRPEFFDMLESVDEGDEVIFHGLLSPRSDFLPDGRKRGRMMLRIHHIEWVASSNGQVVDDFDIEFDDAPASSAAVATEPRGGELDDDSEYDPFA